MQKEMMMSPSNEVLLRSTISAAPFDSLDQLLPSPTYLTNDADLFGLYSPKKLAAPSPATASASLTPSTVSFDDETEDNNSATENRLYLARLTLQYRELAERYELCLSHLQDAADEVEALRQENAELRVAKGELAKRLSLFAGKKNGRIATASIVDEFRRLCVAEEGPSPTSVLGFGRSEKQVALPKSISIRSSGFLKLNPGCSGTGASAPARNSRMRVSSPVMVGSSVHGRAGLQNGVPMAYGITNDRGQQRAYVGGDVGGGGQESKPEGDSALEVEVYNQGMFKTELCNKWEALGECPYGDHCQFAHGISELRPVIRHPRYKTEVCRMVLSGDTCPYGHRCHFRHSLSPSDLLPRPHS